jgi:adenosylhomocysteinase
MEYDVKDLALAPKGKLKIEWAARYMPVLRFLKEKFTKEKPLQGVKISACLHVTSETGNLMDVLKKG